MQACGGCTAQDALTLAQLLANPAVWVVAGATIMTLLGAKKKQEKK